MKFASCFLVVAFAFLPLGSRANEANGLSVKLSEVDTTARAGFDLKAEAKCRELLNEVQTTKNFAHRDVAVVLDVLAPILRKLKKTDEAKDAEVLAKQIRDGLVPLDTNQQIYMRTDKSIAIIKRINPDADSIGFAYVELHPGEESYEGTLNAVGSLVPGQGKLLPSTLESPDEAMGMATISKGSMGVFQKFVYRYKQGGERKAITMENKKMVATVLFDTVEFVDNFSKTSSSPQFVAVYRTEAQHIPIHDRCALAFFLNGPGAARDAYAWLSISHAPDMNTEDMQLLAKAFPETMKWMDAEMAKREAERKANEPNKAK
jgi:hypothetical protein